MSSCRYTNLPHLLISKLSNCTVTEFIQNIPYPLMPLHNTDPVPVWSGHMTKQIYRYTVRRTPRDIDNASTPRSLSACQSETRPDWVSRCKISSLYLELLMSPYCVDTCSKCSEEATGRSSLLWEANILVKHCRMLSTVILV